MDAAINHFIEAGNSDKAIQAAIGAQQWKKAQLILDQSDSPSNAQYYRQIANHYNQTKQFEAAAKMMIKVNQSFESKVDDVESKGTTVCINVDDRGDSGSLAPLTKCPFFHYRIVQFRKRLSCIYFSPKRLKIINS